MFTSLDRSRRWASVSVRPMLVVSLALAASVTLGAGVAVADEPASSDQTTGDQPTGEQPEHAPEVAVGLPPVPTETVPDATPDPRPPADANSPHPVAPVVHVAVGLPPVPSFSVPDAVALSLW